MGSSFLQSLEWEKFQQLIGREVFRLAGILAIKIPLQFGLSWLYVPRLASLPGVDKFLVKIYQTAKENDAVFCKIESINEKINRQFKSLKSKRINWRPAASSHTQPSSTLLIKLKRPAEQIFAEMKPKTRYNIRLAERHRVRVVEEQTLKHFLYLSHKTGDRQAIKFYPHAYYQKMLAVFSGKLKIFTAVQDEKVLASAVVLFWEDTGYYLHGASDHNTRQLMAPFALHWEIIKYAQQAGYEWYDMWGIKIKSQISNLKSQNYYDRIDTSHPWAGITRFKLGFAPHGKIIDYPPAFDLIFKPNWYRIYSLVKKLNAG